MAIRRLGGQWQPNGSYQFPSYGFELISWYEKQSRHKVNNSRPNKFIGVIVYKRRWGLLRQDNNSYYNKIGGIKEEKPPLPWNQATI